MKVYVDKVKLQEYTTKLTAKFKTIFALKGETATDAQVAEAVTDWLDNNVPSGTTVVIDKSLSIDSAAADAKKTGQIKNAIDGTNGLLVLAETSVITSAGIWTAASGYGYHVCLPISGGDTVKLTGGNAATYYAFLTANDHTPGTNANFSSEAGYTSRILLNANTETNIITSPSDAKYLYFAAINNVGTIQAPISVLINGVEMTYNIRKKIDELNNNAIDAANNNEVVQKQLKQNKADKTALDIWGMRGSYDGVYSAVDFSALAFLSGFSLPVFTDGYKTKHAIDLSKYKNISANVTTVKNQTELNSAIQNAASGDTIILKAGRYTRISLNKSINLIGEGEVLITDNAATEFVQTATAGIYKTANNTYSASPSSVFDISMLSNGVIIPLQKVVDPSTVVSTPGSWCWVSATQNIYVHLHNNEIVDGNNIAICDYSNSVIKCKSTSEIAKVYIENITIIGGYSNIFAEDATGYTSQKLIAKDCKFYYAQWYNAISLRGVDGYFQNCECAYARLDGFNYHINDTADNASGDNTLTLSNGFEVDCVGHDNGISDTWTDYSDNGSTCHDGGIAVRINGVYYNNKGGNVADTSESTVSYNYGCYAFDSIAPQNTNRADFWARNGTNMYLYGCRAAGDSQYNLYALNNATIHASKTEYATSSGTIV